MAEFVEGEWKSFVFKMAQQEHYVEILEHLRKNYYPDEPLNKSFGISPAKDEDFDTLTMYNLQQGLSFIVLDKETQKIVGVSVLSRKEKNKDAAIAAMMKSREMKEGIIPFIVSIMKNANIFDIYPDIEFYAHISIISVERESRGQGLAMEMTNRAILQFKAKGYSLVDSIFTSPYTRKIGSKKGFKELSRVRFLDCKNKNGDLVLPGASNDDMASLMVLEI